LAEFEDLIKQAYQPYACDIDDGQKSVGAWAVNISAFKLDFGE